MIEKRCMNKPTYATVAKKDLKNWGADQICLTLENAYLKDCVRIKPENPSSEFHILLLIYFYIYLQCDRIVNVINTNTISLMHVMSFFHKLELPNPVLRNVPASNEVKLDQA